MGKSRLDRILNFVKIDTVLLIRVRKVEWVGEVTNGFVIHNCRAKTRKAQDVRTEMDHNSLEKTGDLPY